VAQSSPRLGSVGPASLMSRFGCPSLVQYWPGVVAAVIVCSITHSAAKASCGDYVVTGRPHLLQFGTGHNWPPGLVSAYVGTEQRAPKHPTPRPCLGPVCSNHDSLPFSPPVVAPSAGHQWAWFVVTIESSGDAATAWILASFLVPLHDRSCDIEHPPRVS
jgi:hypothetical protein